MIEIRNLTRENVPVLEAFFAELKKGNPDLEYDTYIRQDENTEKETI